MVQAFAALLLPLTPPCTPAGVHEASAACLGNLDWPCRDFQRLCQCTVPVMRPLPSQPCTHVLQMQPRICSASLPLPLPLTAAPALRQCFKLKSPHRLRSLHPWQPSAVQQHILSRCHYAGGAAMVRCSSLRRCTAVPSYATVPVPFPIPLAAAAAMLRRCRRSACLRTACRLFCTSRSMRFCTRATGSHC